MSTPTTDTSWLHGLGWVLPAAESAYHHRTDIRKAWNGIRRLLSSRKRQVVITGAQGVGKSVLLDHISGKAKRSYKDPGPSDRIENATSPIAEHKLALAVAPGQPQVKEAALDALFDKNNQIDGIVHVVSFGYTESRALPQVVNQLKLSTLDEYRKHYLKEELEDFKRTAECVRKWIRQANRAGKLKKPLWLIIAINKIDLYFNKLDEAALYYLPESMTPSPISRPTVDFMNEINKLVDGSGQDNIRVDVLPVASFLRRLRLPFGNVAPIIDEPERDHFLAGFCKKLYSYL